MKNCVKIIFLTFVLSFNTSAKSLKWTDFRSAIACGVVTAVAYSLKKDTEVGNTALLACSAIITYDLINRTVSIDEYDVKELIDESAKQTAELLKQYHEKVKKRYAIYRRIIKKALIERLETTETGLDKKIAKLERRLRKSKIKKELIDELMEEVKKEIGLQDVDSQVEESLKKLLPEIVKELKKSSGDSYLN